MGYAEDKTEEELIGLERTITREYRQAYKSVQMKAAKYFGIFEERDKKMREALKDGTYPKLEGASAWMTPEEHYKQWRLAQIGRGKRWEAVRDDLATSITRANEMAANIVNKKTAGIFGLNYNFSAYEIEKKVGKGVAFNIYNEHAVKELLEGKNHTEFRVLHVNRKRDYAWNQQKVQAALTSGILQGQSVPELTDAFLGVMGSNRNAAIRNARTAVTSAQNAGVIESCRKLQEMGIEVLLQWRSAHDGRVRDSHAHLDGVRIKPGETFPNGCRYPGDPQGRGSEVYNCRCTLIKILPKYNGNTIESNNTEADYKAWLERKKAENAEELKGINKNGKEIQFDWKNNDEKHKQQQQIIIKLSNEYNTRLEKVLTGAEKSAGNVDISGSTMRLNSSFLDIAIHEFAHTLTSCDAEKLGLTDDKEFWKEIKKIRRAYRKDVDVDTKRWISSYEHSEFGHPYDEFFAEAFTQAKARELGVDLRDKYGSDLTYSKQVLDVVNKYFKKEHVENVPKNSIIKLDNKTVREKYIQMVSRIKDDIDKTLPIEEQARQAFEARNRIRTEARELMADKEMRDKLNTTRPNKSFEELIDSKMKRKGMTREEAIKDIYDTATKTNESVNKELGLGD